MLLHTKKIVFLFALSFSVLFLYPSALADRIDPGDLVYKGAFRLPDNDEWQYSGYAMTYYPKGDPSGKNDGYPGSLYIVGHDHHQRVSEITIPPPIISSGKKPGDLNVAETLQPFNDIRSGMFGELEIPRAGLAYLPRQGLQKTDKLHFCWGQHFQDNDPSHGWCELDVSLPESAGVWYFNGFGNYVTNDYLFEIPVEWAEVNTPGQYLATGRFRDRQWSGKGPALFAYGPWEEGNPPERGTRLKNITPLLLYGVQEPGAIEITNRDNMKMKYFKEADEWSGASWLSAGDDSALVFVGTKALGRCWYGYSNGVEYPTSGDSDEIYPETPLWPHDDRGWWSEDIEAQIIFYDTDEIAQVAKGRKNTYEPQPYAVMTLDEILYDPGFDLQRAKRYLVGAMCFDRQRGILYIIERRADDEKSLVHVWAIE